MNEPIFPEKTDLKVNEFLINKAHAFNFYQLVNTLLKDQNFAQDDESWEKEYRLFFSANPSLAFARSDVTYIKPLNSFQIEIQTTFLGLNGSQSPLPNFFLDALATDDDLGYRRDFLDFFNHRAISLLYRSWHKYRYYVVYQPNAEDVFSKRLFSFIGLGIDDLRQKSSINWCKMLAYIGMLAGRNRSNQVVSGVISHYFDLDVSVKEWVERYVAIPKDQQTRVGMMNGELGQTTILGSKIRDCASKFVITLHNLTFKRFLDFLPTGKDYATLKEVVEFILRTQMAYDLALQLSPKEAPPLNLSKLTGGYLGWTSFVGDSPTRAPVIIQVRQ